MWTLVFLFVYSIVIAISAGLILMSILILDIRMSYISWNVTFFLYLTPLLHALINDFRMSAASRMP